MKNVTIYWFYDEADEDMGDTGVELKTLSGANIEFCPKKVTKIAKQTV